MMRALVTGASGFIGSRLAAKIAVGGGCVHVIVRQDAVVGWPLNKHEDIVVHRHDGSMKGLLDIFEKAMPSVVFHLAAKTQSMHSLDDIEPLIKSNILFSTQILEVMRQCGVQRFVNTETFWQQSASGAYAPTCLYAAMKQAFFDVLVFYTQAYGFAATSLVLFETYGPRDPRKKLLDMLYDAVVSKSRIKMTPGEQIIDLNHVDDVVAAFLRASELLDERDAGLQKYYVSSGVRMNLRTLVGRVSEVVSSEIDIEWGGKPYRPGEIMLPCVGPVVPGWSPKVSLEDGLRSFFAEARRR